MVNLRLEWILLIAEKSKFLLKGTRDQTIRLPVEYLHAMGWELGEEIEISNAWWDRDKCYRIQIEKTEKPKVKGKRAK